jgi:DNA segregation ATPase FtsK/SpoIIIE, S-DNA-T family
MAKRRSKPKPQPDPSLGKMLRGEIVGGALVVLALLMLLSLLSSNRGELTDAIVDGLFTLFGVGTWLVPFLLGGLGAWLAFREVTDHEILSLRHLIGALILFLVFEAMASIVAGNPDPLAPATGVVGGGLVGWIIGQGLVSALGTPVAVAFLVIVAGVGVFVLSGLTPVELRGKLIGAWQSLQGHHPGPAGSGSNLPLPLGRQEWPWQRWWRQLVNLGSKPAQPANSSSLGPSSWSKETTRTSQPPAKLPTPAAAPTQPQPRVIGGREPSWRLPTLVEILEDSSEQDIQGEDLRRRAHIIETTLEGFGVPVQVVEANQGPAVTQFGLRPGIIVRRDRKGEEKRVKVRVSQIQALTNDLSLALAAAPIRIEAPVPGRDIVGVEVPNVQISLVALRGVMESEEWQANKDPLTFGLGRDVSGQPVVAGLTRMPHLLVAGATGSGKSVCVNSIITALLLSHTPETLRFLMIDPKRVELTVYNDIPHLIAPVVVEVERAILVLQWATREMERRYKLFAKISARNIESYNEKLVARGEQILPYIVIFIDELADLMLSAPDDVERYTCRIAQMARATGIHLVIATQRPSVDVVTGLIKANFPARIAFAVTSLIDSRVILDSPGAEQLLGRGDMLYMAPDTSKLLRLQGCFVSDRETSRLVRYWRGARSLAGEAGQASMAGVELPEAAEPGGDGTETWEVGASDSAPSAYAEPPWLPGQEELQQPLWSDMAGAASSPAGRDELYNQALEEVRKTGRASVSLLQRRLRIGYSRAARIIEELEADGVVGPDLGGSRGREVLPGDDASPTPIRNSREPR